MGKFNHLSHTLFTIKPKQAIFNSGKSNPSQSISTATIILCSLFFILSKISLSHFIFE